MTKTDRLKKLLRRGCTAYEICTVMGTVSPHRRMFELKQQGWTITRKAVKGETYGVYRGVAPKVCV